MDTEYYDQRGPEWVPIPAAGKRCPVTSLSRAAMRMLVVPCRENGMRPPVKSKLLNIPGWGKGRRRFVEVASLRAWMRSQTDGGEVAS